MTSPRRGPVARLLVALVRLYQRTAMVRSPRCRFHPTCSAYALEAIEVHGAARGSWLAVRRIGRCHPFNPGGIDHVPPAKAPSVPAAPAASAGADDHPRTAPTMGHALPDGPSVIGPSRPAR